MKPTTHLGPLLKLCGRARPLATLAAAGLLLMACAHSPPLSPEPAGERPIELGFNELYKMPVGPYGLEPSEKLLGLNGRRVHMRGYVVESEDRIAGLFMMAPLPVMLAEKDDGQADDLPGSTVFVHLPPELAQETILYRPEPVEVIGVLELGAKQEAIDRISYIRLLAEAPQRTAPARRSAAPPAALSRASSH